MLLVSASLLSCKLIGRDSFTVTHHATIKIKGYDEKIHVELYGNEAPGTVKNFVELAEDGFYDGLTFHRIIEVRWARRPAGSPPRMC